jgi:hypothetical protein
LLPTDKRIQYIFRYRMAIMKKLVLSLLLVVTVVMLRAQDTLPKFSVKNVGNKRIIIGWTNTFESIRQISVQRSFDSLTGFKTILTVPDPTTPQNGFVDTKAINDHMFYRIYIMLEKGIFFFSDSKKPVIDTMRKASYNETLKVNGTDSVSIPNFGLNNKPRPEVFVPSLHVYTYKDGNVRINLPEEEEKKYGIKFFEDNGNFLFELKDIKHRSFKLDKSNFYHAGWFRFELYENGALKEKHKFYIEKDF